MRRLFSPALVGGWVSGASYGDGGLLWKADNYARVITERDPDQVR